MERFSRLFFMCSLGFLAYVYGAATVYFRIFPYELLSETKTALDAWLEVTRDDEISLFIRHEEEATPQPRVARIADRPEGADDRILVTGGPYALLSRCPRFGCLAWIMNRRGDVLHSWEVDIGALWADLPGHSGLNDHQRIEPFGLHLSDSGELTATFQSDSLSPYGIGIARFDKDANLIWKKANFAHHWISVAPDGRIFTPAARYVENQYALGDTGEALTCGWTNTIQSDALLVLDRNGDTLSEVSILDVLVANELVGVIANTSDPCDPVHLNFVEYVTEDLARAAGLDAGDVILSVRHMSLVVALDKTMTKVKWASIGRAVQQHSPRILSDGGILVFDNFGGPADKGGSRLLRLRYGSDIVQSVFPRPDTPKDVDFGTRHQGHIDPNPDGRRALVALSLAGRVLELDLETGEVLWEMDNTHDLGAERGGTARLATAGAYYVRAPAFLVNR
jgi:hypothetical protein